VLSPARMACPPAQCTLPLTRTPNTLAPLLPPLRRHRFDVVKSRIQANTAQGQQLGMVGVARELVAAEGVRGLYRGLVPALVRAVPANAACFAGIEYSRALLDKLF
jgi:hypothetical protein